MIGAAETSFIVSASSIGDEARSPECYVLAVPNEHTVIGGQRE